ncbi:MAG: aminodeoxychorismate/anthranilate synthase component II [Flavobacteriales bacterium]|nr:aminodeoxychorismate/anthranilate synthase component II [Flavobacteriales bacterium]
MRIAIIDNYDSFTYNLHHYAEPWVDKVVVIRNDEVEVDDLANYDGIILSPGPGLPAESGRLMEVIEMYHDRLPILGVCLGHQAIAEFFGGRLENLPQVIHGQPSECTALQEDLLFKGISSPFLIGHYHSWVVAEEGFPHEELLITAKNDAGHIMALRHKELPIHGVQFHPESILTPQGKTIMTNWIRGIQRILVDRK